MTRRSQSPKTAANKPTNSLASAAKVNRAALSTIILLLACTTQGTTPPAFICRGTECEDCSKVAAGDQYEICTQCSGAPCNSKNFSTQSGFQCGNMVCRDGKTVYHRCFEPKDCAEFPPTATCGNSWCVTKK